MCNGQIIEELQLAAGNPPSRRRVSNKGMSKIVAAMQALCRFARPSSRSLSLSSKGVLSCSVILIIWAVRQAATGRVPAKETENKIMDDRSYQSARMHPPSPPKGSFWKIPSILGRCATARPGCFINTNKLVD
jgi:hypothetical protein